MPVLIATPKSSVANAYVTPDRADIILGGRLYTTKWDQAGTTPDAEGYLLNGPASIGATSLVIDTGTGTFTKGCKIKVGSDSAVYTVQTALAGAGTLTISPALKVAAADNVSVDRVTASDKEKAIIWATSLLDSLIEWDGTRTTLTQRLRHPRQGLIDSDGYPLSPDVICPLLEVCTAEFAQVLLQTDRFKEPALLGQGFSDVQIGPIKATVDDTQQVEVIPDNILAMLKPLGTMDSGAGTGAKVLSLRRA